MFHDNRPVAVHESLDRLFLPNQAAFVLLV